jgi:hypothetical protein
MVCSIQDHMNILLSDVFCHRSSDFLNQIIDNFLRIFKEMGILSQTAIVPASKESKNLLELVMCN